MVAASAGVGKGLCAFTKNNLNPKCASNLLHGYSKPFSYGSGAHSIER